MKNKLVILLVLIVPIAIYAFMTHFSKNNAAVATNSGEILSKAKLIKFYSPMCSECKTVGTNVSNVLKDYPDSIVFEEINVTDNSDKSKDMIDAYKITVVPTVVFVDKTGKISQKKEGMIEESEIRMNLDEIK